jgi:hypothetical protein
MELREQKLPCHDKVRITPDGLLGCGGAALWMY